MPIREPLGRASHARAARLSPRSLEIAGWTREGIFRGGRSGKHLFHLPEGLCQEDPKRRTAPLSNALHAQWITRRRLVEVRHHYREGEQRARGANLRAG